MMSHILMGLSLAVPAPLTHGPILDPATRGQYCGLYCLQAAASSLGMRPNFLDVYSSEYMTGTYGSSAADLQAAAKAMGLKLHVRGEMTLTQLRAAKHPVILHVRTSGSGTQYIHWCLFLGFQDNKVRLYDPPKSELMLATDELLAVWDGTGLVITREEESVPMAIPVDSLTAVGITVFFSVVFCARPSRYAFLSIPLIAILSSLSWQIVSSPSFLKNRAGTDLVALAHFRTPAPELDFETFETERVEPDSVLIDARTSQDYQIGHIPKAISISSSSSIPALQMMVDEIPRDRHVIVYCASNSCPWADEISNQFIQRDYRRVSIFRGGYQEWSRQRAARRASREPNP